MVVKGRGRRPLSFPVWVVSIEGTQSWISVPESDFAYGGGWPVEDVSISCCIAGFEWASSTVVSQKGGPVLFWIPNSGLAIGCKGVIGIRSTREWFQVNLCVLFYV